MKTFEKKEIVKKSIDFDRWYTDVILKAELADYAPVKGCMVIRPYGFALWERIQSFLDKLIKEKGVENAYFPIFIPEKFLKLEQEHVEGFVPHLAVVTIAGGQKLNERLVVRPTSETVMYEMYKKWTQSWRQLPILINQWNNVVRWEKRTYLFLRTSEFLWQEGHCAHATHKESTDIVKWALGVYEKTYNELMALYGIAGIKSEVEKFAGAAQTLSYELIMPNGKALQACTSHDLSQNFAKAFDWTVLDKDGKKLYPWQNSWGFSTRSIGGLIMAHGDDQGLVLPPAIAPIQIVIIPIPGSSKGIYDYAGKIEKRLKTVKWQGENIRCFIDSKEGETVGFKYNKWELKGVPVRIEIGEKEIKNNELSVYRRDTGQKSKIKNPQHQSVRGRQKSKTISDVSDLLTEIQRNLFAQNKKFVEENTQRVDDYLEFKEIMRTKKGLICAFWCENPVCEKKIKEETKATTRVLPLDAKEEKGKCIYCGQPAKNRWYFAQAY